MRRRSGFTLIEMLVSVALVLFIMVILSEAFGTALQAFRQLKATGDLEARLRDAATLLRNDLSADHFDGRRRLSDPWNAKTKLWPPREGFVRLAHLTDEPIQDEGADADLLPSRRTAHHVLHFSVKLRGNERTDFFSAAVPPLPNSPLLTQRTNFFNHPNDARYQDTAATYNSQWAEIAYFLLRQDAVAGRPQLYNLYRSQLVVVVDNSTWNVNFAPEEWMRYAAISCQPDPLDTQTRLHFNTPVEMARPFADTANLKARRAFPALNLSLRNPSVRRATQVLSEVLTFDVQVLTGANFTDLVFDTADLPTESTGDRVVIQALKITLRVWDMRTQQTRQVTIIQDL